jgi:hypothetical protein
MFDVSSAFLCKRLERDGKIKKKIKNEVNNIARCAKELFLKTTKC